MSTSSDLNTLGCEKNSPCAGLAPDAFPEARSSKNGVSVRYVHDPDKKWYVMRASYGREDKALDLIVADGTFSYIAKRYAEKYVNGKRRRVLESLIPNLLFVYTTKEKAEEYVKGTPALSYITYYYNHFELDDNQKNPPLTVSCEEMDNFMLATASMNEHLMFVQQYPQPLYGLRSKKLYILLKIVLRANCFELVNQSFVLVDPTSILSYPLIGVLEMHFL